jgi:xanthine dehydrogenase accessory factor
MMSSRDDNVWDEALAWSRGGHRVALATVIETWGSSPRPRGSYLVVREDGVFLGSVSGGCVEGKVVEAALKVLPSGAPTKLRFGVSNEDAWSIGLVCGGKVEIRIEPIGPKLAAVFEAIAEALAERRAGVAFTPLNEGDPFFWKSGDPELELSLAAAATRALASDEASILETPSGSVFVRPLNPPLRLFVIGAVHIARPLVSIARELAYDVTLIDPRGAFTRPERWPADVAVETAWPDEALAKHGVDARSAIVALTHDPKIDDVALEFALKTKAFYVGALGSRKSHASRLARLEERGFDEASRSRIHGPVGLAIGARSPAEIAVSIVAQMTEVLRRAKAAARPKVGAIVVAAGLSRRMEGENKLVAEVNGKAIVAHVVDALVAAAIDPVLVVVGHRADEVRNSLEGRSVRFVENPNYEEGLGSSIRAGFQALGGSVEAALVALGDMPRLSSEHVSKIVGAFDPKGPRSICVPVHEGRRGHPVLWSSRHFVEMDELSGDVGARGLLDRHADKIRLVPIDDGAIHFDVDTRELLAEARLNTSE